MHAERKVGLVVTGALALLFLGVLLIGKVRLGVSGYPLNVRFRFVNDLRVDAPVKYAGGPVIGHVRSITVAGDDVNVVAWIDRDIRIRQDSVIWVFTTGILGEMYLEIDASQSGTAPYLAEGATIRGEDPISVDATINRVGKIVDAIYPIFAKEEVAASVHKMITALNGAAGRIAQVVDHHASRVDQALTDLETFSAGLRRLSTDLDTMMSGMRDLTNNGNPQGIHAAIRKLNDAMDSFQTTAKTVAEVADKLDKGQGTLAVLLNDPQMAADLKAVVKKFKDQPITAKVRLF